ALQTVRTHHKGRGETGMTMTNRTGRWANQSHHPLQHGNAATSQLHQFVTVRYGTCCRMSGWGLSLKCMKWYEKAMYGNTITSPCLTRQRKQTHCKPTVG